MQYGKGSQLLQTLIFQRNDLALFLTSGIMIQPHTILMLMDHCHGP